MADITSQTIVQLGFVPINRGDYIAEPETRYYKDNIVQFNGSAFIADPVDFDLETNPHAYVTEPPYSTDIDHLNEGWKVLASDAEYCKQFFETIENPEFVSVTLDRNQKIVEGTRVDGTKVLGAGVEVNEDANIKGNVSIGGDTVAMSHSTMTVIDNPEFVRVDLDKDGKILWGIQKDGNFLFGAGVPSQVISYIESRIADLSLDEYEDIVTFLNDLEKGTDNLSVLLGKKVDKQEGQSLIDKNFAESVDYTNTDNPEFIDVKLDAEEKVLEGTQKDGTKIFGADIKVGGSATISGDVTILGDVELSGASYSVVNNPEYVKALVDAEDKLIIGIKTDGTVYIPVLQNDSIDAQVEAAIAKMEQALANIPTKNNPEFTGKISLDKEIDETTGEVREASIENANNPEWIQVTTDAEGKILEGITTEGKKKVMVETTVESDLQVQKKLSAESLVVNGATVNNIENPEFIATVTDADGRLLSSRQPDGSLKEYVGIETSSLTIDDKDSKDYVEDISCNSVVSNPEFISVTTDASGKILSGRRASDGNSFEAIGYVSPKIEIDGNTLEGYNDNEERTEITIDNSSKVISYRDKEGILHENIAIKTPSIFLSEEGQKKLQEDLNSVPSEKNWYLPKFGKVNIKSETFYLTADQRWNTKDDVVCIQMYDDTAENARLRLVLSYFYILDNSITGTGSDGNSYAGNLVTHVGGYKYYVTSTLEGGQVTENSIEVTFNRISVNENSIKLDLYPAKEVSKSGGKFYLKSITKVNGDFYLTSTLNSIEEGGTTIYTINTETGGGSVKVNTTLEAEEQQTLTNAIEVNQIVDEPPYKAWTVNKELEHYCIADIDFGKLYINEDVPVSIKYQGSGSSSYRQRGLRLTFFKANDYKKKDKIKIGEMVRLSGYNMKSFGSDPTRILDPVLSWLIMEIWESRGNNAFPWSKDNVYCTGATGMIKSFPIETWFGEEFFGLQYFGLKKDERNYMLDGDDDASGIFASGYANDSSMWTSTTSEQWDDEMGADGRELAYPLRGDDSVSVETAAAIDIMLKHIRGYIYGYKDYKDQNDNVYDVYEVYNLSSNYSTGTVLVEGQEVAVTGNTKFKKSMLSECLDINSWLDYFICLQIFQLWDNNYHNMNLYSGSDKQMFYPFLYDLDQALKYDYDKDFFDVCKGRNIDTRFWKKLAEDYKDNIINRYFELRKSALSEKNINDVYYSILDNIPKDVIVKSNTKWGNADPRLFKSSYLIVLKEHLKWLDTKNFNI